MRTSRRACWACAQQEKQNACLSLLPARASSALLPTVHFLPGPHQQLSYEMWNFEPPEQLAEGEPSVCLYPSSACTSNCSPSLNPNHPSDHQPHELLWTPAATSPRHSVHKQKQSALLSARYRAGNEGPAERWLWASDPNGKCKGCWEGSQVSREGDSAQIAWDSQADLIGQVNFRS